MRLYQLAWQNVKSSLKNYLSLILSLAFTVMIFLNFQNMVYADALDTIGSHNKNYSDMLVQTLSVVLGVFMVFFTGYATNVFLTRRKKEIGIYVFMGLTNQKIGRLYMMEMGMVGILTLFAGIGAGILSTKLFQMILFAMSDITADIGFQFTARPVLHTAVLFLAVFLFFVCKGYVSIVRSSILNLVSASRQNEYVRQNTMTLMCKTVLGVAFLTAGYYLAVRKGGQEVLQNALIAVILVIAGVYLLFGGLIPVIFQGLVRNKRFLYRRERCLWVNQLIFRMKKNYRTYAMTCVLMTCSVTALAAGFALKERYNGMVHFRNTYTYQLLSVKPDLEDKAERLIEQENDIVYHTKLPILVISDPGSGKAESEKTQAAKTESWMLLGFTQVKQAADAAGIAFQAQELKDGEMIELSHLYLLSLLTKRENVPVKVLDKQFLQISEMNAPFLGYLQETMNYYIINDSEYEKLRPLGQELYSYNYKIKDTGNYKASADALGTLVSSAQEDYTARVVTSPDSSEWEWVKILYSLCIFICMVFIVASGSILFMKLYNDAFEEQDRYSVLQKTGYSYGTLRRAVTRELFAAYALPFAVMTVSSIFSVKALENMMYTSLLRIRLASTAVIFAFFLVCYGMSVGMYLKNAGIRRNQPL